MLTPGESRDLLKENPRLRADGGVTEDKDFIATASLICSKPIPTPDDHRTRDIDGTKICNTFDGLTDAAGQSL